MFEFFKSIFKVKDKQTKQKEQKKIQNYKKWTKNINGHLIEYDWTSKGYVYVRNKSELFMGWKKVTLKNCNPLYNGKEKAISWKQAKFMATNSKAAI